MKDVYGFRNKYFFLSNFYPCTIMYEGLVFNSSEAAFQSMKDPDRMREFCNLKPGIAKKLGRMVKLRPDWDEVKDDKDLIMPSPHTYSYKISLLLKGCLITY